MPFRVPLDYKGLSVHGCDPSHDELIEYYYWLLQEIGLIKHPVNMILDARESKKRKERREAEAKARAAAPPPKGGDV